MADTLIERLKVGVPYSPKHDQHDIRSANWTMEEAADALTALERERDALREALEDYMSQFGQALVAHGIPFGPAQTAAHERARNALQGKEPSQ